MLVLFISDHERNGGLFMNKKIISLLLGACLCTSLAGCGNADNNGGSVTKQKLLASKEVTSQSEQNRRPSIPMRNLKTVSTILHLTCMMHFQKTATVFIPLTVFPAHCPCSIRVPGAKRKRNWNQHLASKIFQPGIRKCKAI